MFHDGLNIYMTLIYGRDSSLLARLIPHSYNVKFFSIFFAMFRSRVFHKESGLIVGMDMIFVIDTFISGNLNLLML